MTTRATIVSDASLCHQTGAAGWAAWAKSDKFKNSRMWSGALKVKPRDSTEAELFAIANALHAACSSGMVENETEVMLQSDSTVALGFIRAKIVNVTESMHDNSVKASNIKASTPMTENVSNAINAIEALMVAKQLKLVIRHVKGHTKGDGRQWVNRQCDMMAKKAMKEARSNAESI